MSPPLPMPAAAVLMPNWVGDFLLALAVAEGRPEAAAGNLVLIVPEHLVELCRSLSTLPCVANRRRGVIGMLQSAAAVRRLRCARLYILPYSFSSALFGLFTGIGARRGIVHDGRRLLLTEALPRATRTSKRHITQEYAAVLDVPAPRLDQWRGRPVAGGERHAGAVALCPGARFGPARLWPWYAELARMLPDQRIVVEGSVEERPQAQAIAAMSPGNVTDLTGTSLVEAAAVLSVAACVVSNDSGLMHLAGFVGAPVVGIFGSTPPAWTRPLGGRLRVMYRGEPCSPCLDRTCRFGHYDCLRKIGPELVAQALAGVAGRAT
jgi:heptosyltransferase II